MSDKTVKLIDEASGKQAELPLVEPTLGASCIDIKALYKQTGHYTLDMGFAATASTRSAITFIDGEKGVLLYRGYPIKQLAEHSSFVESADLLLNGELPDADALEAFEKDLASHAQVDGHIDNILSGFDKNAHPMAMMTAAVAALSAQYHEGLDVENAEDRKLAATRLIAKMPTIAAACYRHAKGEKVPETSEAKFVERFLTQMFATGSDYKVNPVVAKALDLLFILHADHEQNASASTVRLVGSTGANPYASVAAGITALWGPAHGGANEAVLKQLAEIGSPDNVESAVKRAKDKDDSFRLMGFGHRVYKNFDPRATIIRGACHEVLEELGVDDPLLDVAMKLEEAALQDDYFVQRKLYPNVDFYSGIIYKALGIPTEMFTVMFAIARTAGWVSHWIEHHETKGSRIGRPRQVYVGADTRDYVALDKRG
ncbi:MAG TPA: citrate synthase [Oleiagrimonas sp.]|nr:citrate synthase [Oleiagrimonas sp.]